MGMSLTLPSLSKREGNYIQLLLNPVYNSADLLLSTLFTPTGRQAGFGPSPCFSAGWRIAMTKFRTVMVAHFAA